MTSDLPGGQPHPNQPTHSVYVRIGPDVPRITTRSFTGAGGSTVNLDFHPDDVIVGVEVIDATGVEVDGVGVVPVGGQPRPDTPTDPEAPHDDPGGARLVRQFAEDKFYDGDNDRPLPGYAALLDIADRLDPAGVRGEPHTTPTHAGFCGDNGPEDAAAYEAQVGSNYDEERPNG